MANYMLNVYGLPVKEKLAALTEIRHILMAEDVFTGPDEEIEETVNCLY